MIPRPRRFDLTPLLDVLLIVFFATLISAAAAESEDVAEAEAATDEAESEADGLRRDLAERERELLSTREVLRTAEQRAEAASHSREALADRLARLESLLDTTELFQEMDSAAGGVLQELLQERLVIVSLYLSDNEVAEYQRFGQPERSALRHPIPLVQIRRQGDGPDDYEAQYIGDFFPRLFEVLDASLVQREGDNHTFYLVVPDDTNICETYWGLAREVRGSDRLQVIMPQQDCPEEPS